MQGRKEAGQQGQQAPLGRPTCRARGSLACWVWRTDKILQQSVSPGRGWDRLGPCAQASTLLSPGAVAGGHEWVQTGSLCGLGPAVIPLCASNVSSVEHLRASPVPSPGPGTLWSPCHQTRPVPGREGCLQAGLMAPLCVFCSACSGSPRGWPLRLPEARPRATGMPSTG